MALKLLSSVRRGGKFYAALYNTSSCTDNNIKLHQPNTLQFNRHYSFSTKDSAMRFIQFKKKSLNSTHLGLVSEDGASMVDLSAQCPHLKDMIQFIKSGNTGLQKIQEKIDDFKWECVSDDIELLAPVSNPEKIICIGLNYAGHCLEQNKEPPKEPMFFSKFASTLVGPTGDVIHHNITTVSVQ